MNYIDKSYLLEPKGCQRKGVPNQLNSFAGFTMRCNPVQDHPPGAPWPSLPQQSPPGLPYRFCVRIRELLRRTPYRPRLEASAGRARAHRQHRLHQTSTGHHLSRCIQTAIGIFGSGNSLRPGESKFNALMQNNVAGRRPGISTQGCPKFMAMEWCRECMGVHPCDRRRPISQLQDQYPAIDFSEIISDQDVQWKRDQREKEQEVQYRAQVFANWLLDLTEIRIAVVAHSGFIWEFTRLFGDDLSGNAKSELQDGYANCEMRSMVLVDKVGVGQVFGGTDFPGCSERYFPE